MRLSTRESSVSVDQRQVEPFGHGEAPRWRMLAGATAARPRRCSPEGDARWGHGGTNTGCSPEGDVNLISLPIFNLAPVVYIIRI
jgi:hypothetical protein